MKNLTDLVAIMMGKMKNVLFFVLLLFIISSCYSQETGIPKWFVEEMEWEIGTWIGDNSKYKSDQEPFESYVIEWNWGINKKSLIGKMYAVHNDKASEPFWEFRKYWDGEKQMPIVMQFGNDGTFGIGALTRINEKESKLLQIFTTPNGSQYKSGHKNVIIDSISQLGNSYSINEKNEWAEQRSYTWVKKE